MTTRSLPFATTAILLLSMTACVGGDSAESAGQHETDPGTWAQEILGEGLWQGDGVSAGAGGIAPGADAGLTLSPQNPGWNSITMACKGPSSMSVKITGSDGEISSGMTPCGTPVTTTVELPAGRIDITVAAVNAKGMWALAIASTEAP